MPIDIAGSDTTETHPGTRRSPAGVAWFPNAKSAHHDEDYVCISHAHSLFMRRRRGDHNNHGIGRCIFVESHLLLAHITPSHPPPPSALPLPLNSARRSRGVRAGLGLGGGGRRFLAHTLPTAPRTPCLSPPSLPWQPVAHISLSLVLCRAATG